MSIPFTRWPEEFARRYREKGYWQDLPLTDILTRHAASDSIAVIDGERQLSYRELNQAADNLACSLRRQGIKPGETALVQLGNVAELYITFFALLKLGVAPVLALFSHQRSELNAYASQIEPALLIADRQHALFSGDDFLNTFVTEHSSIRVVQLLNDSGEHNLQDAINHPAEDFTATPSPADEVAYFQLSGGTTGTPKLIPRTHNDYYYSVRRDPLEHESVKAVTAEVEAALGNRGRVLLRKSGTEPLIRVMVEGEDEAQVTEFAHRIADAVKAV